MYKKWWDTPVCWLCDYGWAVLFALALIFAVYFTRAYWVPLIGIEDTPPIFTVTPENASIIRFTEPKGKYALSYPANWVVENLGNQTQQWSLPDGVVMSVHSESAVSGDTLETYSQEVVTRLPYDVMSQSQTVIGEQPAIRQEIAYPGETTRVALGYLVLYDGKKYQIALAGLENIQASDQERFIQEFEKTMTTFQFK